MDFLVPLLIVVLVVAVVLVIMRLVSRRKGEPNQERRPTVDATTATTKEAAAAASARLNQQQHMAVYALIARGQAVAAIREYRNATGAGLREAASAVAQLSAHPQPYTTPEDTAPAEGPVKADRGQSAAPMRSNASSYRYRAIVSKGDTIREIASTRLNDEIFTHIRTAALSGDRPGAVRLLIANSEATEAEAVEFVDLIEPEEES